MSRARTLTTEAERQRFERFLISHSGKLDGCLRHPSVSEMTYPQLCKVMMGHLGFAPTRQCVAKTCKELKIRRRRAPGPPRMPEEARKAASNGRWARWHKKVTADPVAAEAYRKRKREASKKRMERLRLNPEAWERFLAQRRRYLRQYRARQR